MQLNRLPYSLALYYHSTLYGIAIVAMLSDPDLVRIFLSCILYELGRYATLSFRKHLRRI